MRLAILLHWQKLFYSATLEDIARKLCELHQPLTINYQQKFGIQDRPAKQIQPIISTVKTDKKTTYFCRKCHSENVRFNMESTVIILNVSICDGNTPINVFCDKERLAKRVFAKEGERFFRECHICNSSELYFTNEK